MGAVHHAPYSFNPQSLGLAPSLLSLATLYYLNFSEGRLTAAERRRPCRADLSGSADPHEA
jgi:hypothetical protein